MAVSNGVPCGSMGDGPVIGHNGGDAIAWVVKTAGLAVGEVGVVLCGGAMYSSGDVLSVFEYSY